MNDGACVLDIIADFLWLMIIVATVFFFGCIYEVVKGTGNDGHRQEGERGSS